MEWGMGLCLSRLPPSWGSRDRLPFCNLSSHPSASAQGSPSNIPIPDSNGAGEAVEEGGELKGRDTPSLLGPQTGGPMEHLSLSSPPCSSAFPQLCAVLFLQPNSVPLTTVRMEPRGNTFCPYPRIRPQKSLLGFGLEEEVCSLVHSCQKPGEQQERAEGLPALQVWEKSSGLLEGWIPSRMKDLEALAPPDM